MKLATLTRSIVWVMVAIGMWLQLPAHAIVVTPTSDVSTLVSALVSGGSGLNVLSASLSYRSGGGAMSTGTFTNASGTYGIPSGIVLSTGNVADYGDGPNQSGSWSTSYGVSASSVQNALLSPITNASDHYDVTQLDLVFTTSTGGVYLYFVFGSEEYPEYVGSVFNDGFGVYLDGTNIAQVNGYLINVSHPDMGPVSGTELDGLIAPNNNPLLLLGVTGLNPLVPHTLTFILGDASDSSYDTTVYLSSLSGGVVIPEPGTWMLMLSGLLAIVKRPRC